MDVGARDGDALARRQRRAHARLRPVVAGRREADDRLAALGARRAAQELALRGDAAVELAPELVDADLAGQVDRERLRDRHHPVLRGDRHRMADDVDRLEREQRVAVDEVVQPPAADREAGDDLAPLPRLAPAGEDAALQQRDDPVGDDVGVDTEVAPVREVLERGVGDAAEADLQRRAVLDDAADVAGDPLDDLRFGRRVHVFDERRVDRHQPVDLAHVHRRVAHRARHRRVDLGDDERGARYGRRQHVDGDAQAHVAELVRRRHLDQRDVDADAADGDQLRHARDRHRHVFGEALPHRGLHVRADEDRPVPEAGGRAALRVVRHRAVGDEVHELEVRRGRRHRLQRRDERARRRTGGADEDVAAAGDVRNRLRRGGHLVAVRREPRVERGARGCRGDRRGASTRSHPVEQPARDARQEIGGAFALALSFVCQVPSPFAAPARHPPRGAFVVVAAACGPRRPRRRTDETRCASVSPRCPPRPAPRPRARARRPRARSPARRSRRSDSSRAGRCARAAG